MVSDRHLMRLVSLIRLGKLILVRSVRLMILILMRLME